MRWGQSGQTTTEYLMISGIMTAIAIFILKSVFAPPHERAARTLCGDAFTIQCILQRVVDDIINDPLD